MTVTEIYTSPSWRDTLTTDSLYFIAFAWLFGQSVWQSFFGGVIAHKALTRQTFTVLQARTFPIYFAVSAILSALLAGLWVQANVAEIRGNYLGFGNSTVQQAWVILSVTVLSFVNWFYIGPVTNKIIVHRQRLERAEGKPYYDPGASSQMKKINSSFGKWHGISALANLVMILALLYHGMWIANFGLQNKATKAGLL